MKVGEVMNKIIDVRNLQDELNEPDNPVTETMREEILDFLGEYIDMLRDMKVQG